MTMSGPTFSIFCFKNPKSPTLLWEQGLKEGEGQCKVDIEIGRKNEEVEVEFGGVTPGHY